MILGEVLFAQIGIETLAGGGVTGMLVAIMVVFMRRTKDTDERRDEAARMLMEAARQQEARAWQERDKALAELERVRDGLQREIDRLREQYDIERRRYLRGQGWTTETDSNRQPPPRNRPRPGDTQGDEPG